MKDKKIGSTLVNQNEIIFYNVRLQVASRQKRGTKKLFLTVLNCCHDYNGEYMQNKQTKKHTH